MSVGRGHSRDQHVARRHADSTTGARTRWNAPAIGEGVFLLYNDKNSTCADCGQEFVFTASEQDFYAQRGFTEPRRCASLPRQPQGCAKRRGWRLLVRQQSSAVAIRAAPAATPAVAVVVATSAHPARCSRRRARPVARKPRSRSVPRVASPSTAATASAASGAISSGHAHATRAYPGSSASPGSFRF